MQTREEEEGGRGGERDKELAQEVASYFPGELIKPRPCNYDPESENESVFRGFFPKSVEFGTWRPR